MGLHFVSVSDTAAHGMPEPPVASKMSLTYEVTPGSAVGEVRHVVARFAGAAGRLAFEVYIQADLVACPLSCEVAWRYIASFEVGVVEVWKFD